jgi:hypothetical protein
MAGNSKKGGMWERDISKYLSKWLTGNEKPYMWWRSPGSGSIGYNLNQHLSGDIIPIKDEAKFFPFCIEAKNGYPKNSDIQNHLSSTKFNIEGFWKQVNEESKDKLPMLIYKKTRSRSVILGINKEANDKLEDILNYLNSVIITWGDKENKLPNCYIYDMDDFFKLITPEIIKERFKK